MIFFSMTWKAMTPDSLSIQSTYNQRFTLKSPYKKSNIYDNNATIASALC